MELTTRSALSEFVRFIACLLALLYCSPRLIAQQATFASDHEVKPISDLETKQVNLMLDDQPVAAIIQAVSQQIGYGIVIDGKPLQSRASFNLHTSAKAALDLLADRFDCSWVMGKHGAILMYKRFHQPGDLPQIHLKEMQKMAADLLAIWPENASQRRLSYYPFTTVPIGPANALFRTFTRDQHQYLESGNWLFFKDLSPEQQSLVRLGILNGAANTSHDVWEGLNARLAGMPRSYLQWRSWFHDQPDPQFTPFRYSLEYIWPDPQSRGYDRIVPANMVYTATGENVK